MSLALDLFVQAFGTSNRTPRSLAYQNGAKSALQRIFDGAPHVVPLACAVGTTDFDAHLSGRLEGQQIAADYIESLETWGVPVSGFVAKQASCTAETSEIQRSAV